jgi:ABC-type uncharacterized transport system permease subunit
MKTIDNVNHVKVDVFDFASFKDLLILSLLLSSFLWIFSLMPLILLLEVFVRSNISNFVIVYSFGLVLGSVTMFMVQAYAHGDLKKTVVKHLYKPENKKGAIR